jgi:uncharacterized protein (DUF362 family)
MKINLKGMPQRSFLYALGITLLMLFTFRWRGFWWPFIMRPKKGVPLPTQFNRFREGEKTLVSIVHGRNIEKSTRTAIDVIGGIEKLDVFKKTILLKPNILSGSLPPATTNPMVIRSVAKILYESGARRVLVGRMSVLSKLPTRKNMDATFIKLRGEEVGAELVPFEEGRWVSIDLPQGRFLNKVYAPEILFEVERIINLPVIKTHASATYGIVLENLGGAIHFKQRPDWVDQKHGEEVLAELNLAWSPDLHIVDGARVMVEGGPLEGIVRDANLSLPVEIVLLPMM